MKLHHKVRHGLKHVFIPHVHNDYKPHFFREFSISLLLVMNLALFTVSGSSALVINNTDLGAHIVVNVLIDLTNQNRIENNLTALVHNPLLDQAAQLKAEDMVRNGYFAHYSPTGVTPWFWFGKVGYYFLYAGENLAVNFTESADVENAWMKSPLHRANILDTRFKEIGLATSNGIYEGNNTTFVVQLFGTPSFAVTSKAITDFVGTSTEGHVATVSSSTKKQVLGSVSAALKKPTPQEKPIVEGETFTPEDKSSLVPVTESQSLAIVKNTEAKDTLTPPTQAQSVPTYSSWYERFIYNSPGFVTNIYGIFIIIVSLALCLMVFIEIKKQHPKNIMYGVLTLSILFLCMYLNQVYFVKVIPFI